MTRKADKTVLSLEVPTLTPSKAHASGGATVVALIDPTYDRLTSNNACVILIDHQIGPLWELEFAEARRRVVELAGTASQLRLPTVITAIGIDTLGPVIPELTNAFEDAPHIARSTANAWNDDRIRRIIESTGRKKLILAGSAADVGVALCAKSALAAGYDVYVPVDASAHFSHGTSRWLAQAGAIVTTVSLVINELGNDILSSSHNRSRRRGFVSADFHRQYDQLVIPSADSA